MEARIKAAAQDRSAGATRLNIDIDPTKYGFDAEEKLDLSTYKVDPRAGCCPGCGASFQPKDQSAPGYLPLEKLEQMLADMAAGIIDFEAEEEELLREDARRAKDTVCQRCHKLKYYGQVEDSLRPGIRTAVAHSMQDVHAYDARFLYNLPKIVGENPVVIAANKAHVGSLDKSANTGAMTLVDLLPKDMSRDRVRTWIKDECRARGIRNMEMKDVHLLSCKNGYGVAALMKKVRERALDLAVDIYVIGAANVGKSTFINHLLQDKSIVKKGKASTRNKLLSQGLTVSDAHTSNCAAASID
eukprot:1588-Heterococcus_DN1.PRE.5